MAFRQWFDLIFKSLLFLFSTVNFSQNWMLMLRADVNVHRATVNGNNMRILL